MKTYLVLAGVVLLASCASPGIPITRDDSQIAFPSYSIVVPPDRGWHLLRPDAKAEVAIVTKQIDLDPGDAAIVLKMQFLKSDILDAQRRTWPARQVADEVRNMERQIMLQQGVATGQYRLGLLAMGEESVGSKKFYTMKYTTSSRDFSQTASLYLHFPREEKNAYFLVIHYSETRARGVAIAIPGTSPTGPFFGGDFVETLRSLRINE